MVDRRAKKTYDICWIINNVSKRLLKNYGWAIVKNEGECMKTEYLFKRTLKVLGNLVSVTLLIVTLSLALFGIKSKLDGGTPNFAGYKAYVVLTGSMVPVFDPGSIVVVKNFSSQQVSKGDIITFKEPGDSTRIVTHRVAEIKKDNGGLSFITKGDANDGPDKDPIPAGNLIGKVTYSMPYVGYLADFVKTKKGMVIFLVIPGLIYILYELRNIYKILGEYESKHTSKELETKDV